MSLPDFKNPKHCNVWRERLRRLSLKTLPNRINSAQLTEDYSSIERLPDSTSLQQFHELFSHNIRVMLDWERLGRTTPTIDRVIVTDSDEVGSLYTTLYLDREKDHEQTFLQSAEKPMRVSEAAENSDCLFPHRVEYLERPLPKHELNTLVLPMYSVNDGLLLLDGNHRIIRAQLHRRESRILGLVINAPIDPLILPDLTFWASRSVVDLEVPTV